MKPLFEQWTDDQKTKVKNDSYCEELALLKVNEKSKIQEKTTSSEEKSTKEEKTTTSEEKVSLEDDSDSDSELDEDFFD